MMKIKAIAFTEKGQVRPAVRNAIVEKVASDRNIFAQAVRVDNKGQFYVEVQDANGSVVYVNFEVTVSGNCIANRAPKTRKPKASDSDSVDFE